MYDRSQLLRGTLEGCILKVIGITPTYGYDIAQQLMALGFAQISEGTLYPLLVRLEKKKLIWAEFLPSPLGPNRKYYTLTDEGHAYLADFALCWEEITRAVERVMNMNKEEQP